MKRLEEMVCVGGGINVSSTYSHLIPCVPSISVAKITTVST